MSTSPVNRIGIIGFGNMGEALFKGLRKKNPKIELLVAEKAAVRKDLALQKYKATDCTSNLAELFKNSDCVVLAVKPQDLKAWLETNKAAIKGSRIITILAGVPLASYLAASPDAQFARCMPSLAASVGKAVSGLSFSANSTEDFKVQARYVTEAMGSCLEIPEAQMPAITALSGSGVALVFEFINAMAMGAVRTGIAYDKALPAALDMIEGAVAVLKKEKIHPAEMVSKVCSPAGTTIEGIHALDEAGFSAGVMNALSAIADRVKALENPR